MRQLVRSRSQPALCIVGLHAVLGHVDHRLGMLDADAHRKRLRFHCDFPVREHPEGISGAVAQSDDGSSAGAAPVPVDPESGQSSLLFRSALGAVFYIIFHFYPRQTGFEYHITS